MNHLKHIKEEEMIVQKISDNSPQLSSQSSQQLPQLSPLPFLSYSPSQQMFSQVGPVRRKVTERQSSMEGKLFRCSLLISTQGRFKKNKKKMVGLIHPGWLAGVSRGPKSNQKNNCFKKKYKYDQNGLIHPEKQTLIFHYWGGQVRNHGCQSDFLTSTIWF